MVEIAKYLHLVKRGPPHHHLKFQDTNLFLALMLWLCTLPLLALVAYPFLGWKITFYLAAFLLVADLVACWFLCTFRLRPGSEQGKVGKKVRQ
jgi:hypothetical protein